MQRCRESGGWRGSGSASGSVDYVVRRTKSLKEHADAVLNVRTSVRQARLEMLRREVQVGALDGLLPWLAQQAGENNLPLRRKDLDKELRAELERLQGVLQRKLTVKPYSIIASNAGLRSMPHECITALPSPVLQFFDQP